MNITAGRAIGNAVRTTLGPKGMDKMLVDSDGDVVVTNDGVTILSQMDIDHPAADMMVEVAETQEGEVGDGTTTAVILAGALLHEAEVLLEQDIHPTTIATGYRKATERAEDVLEEAATAVDVDDVDTLERIAQTVMTGKSAEDAREHLAQIVVGAVTTVTSDEGISMEDIDVRTAPGRPVAASELIEGVLVEGEPVHEGMPTTVENARIALLDTGVEMDEPEIDADISVDDPQALQEFKDAEEASMKERVEHIVETGANVVFAADDIEDVAAQHFADHDVLAVEDLEDEDLARLARVTSTPRVTTVQELTEDDLGEAGRIGLESIGEDDYVSVEEVPDAAVTTVIVRGGTEGVVDEIERAVVDSLHAVRVAILSEQVLGGGGAPETEVALAIRDYADSVGGREQLAIEAFADALEIVPKTLAENAGLDPIDSLVELRARHDGGERAAGLDARTGEVIDMYEEGTVEPLPVKRQAIGSATEAAVMILRIDDVISAS